MALTFMCSKHAYIPNAAAISQYGLSNVMCYRGIARNARKISLTLHFF
jgi:hypothetical protein